MQRKYHISEKFRENSNFQSSVSDKFVWFVWDNTQELKNFVIEKMKGNEFD